MKITKIQALYKRVEQQKRLVHTFWFPFISVPEHQILKIILSIPHHSGNISDPMMMSQDIMRQKIKQRDIRRR
jgi:hypothetical protein